MSEMDISSSFWDDWNMRNRKPSMLMDVSLDQMRVILRWLSSNKVENAEILDVGCGTGWLCDKLVPFGHVTGTDLSAQCLEEAKRRVPTATFVAGDFMALDFPEARYDVICSIEVLSHVANQPAFMGKIARLLKPGGLLMLATQNKPMLARWAKVQPVKPGQLRKWTDQAELRALLQPAFDVTEMFTITPIAHKMPLRLLTANRVRRMIPHFKAWQEKRGWGWTIMALAKKRL